MSYSSDPQAIVYHPEISPKQTDTHFKTMISFFSTQAILEGKKITIKKQSLKTVKSKLEGGLTPLVTAVPGSKNKAALHLTPPNVSSNPTFFHPMAIIQLGAASLGASHVLHTQISSSHPQQWPIPMLGTPRICPFPTLLPLAHLNTLVPAHQERQGKDTAFHIQALRTRDQINIFCTLWQVKSCADMVWWHR